MGLSDGKQVLVRCRVAIRGVVEDGEAARRRSGLPGPLAGRRRLHSGRIVVDHRALRSASRTRSLRRAAGIIGIGEFARGGVEPKHIGSWRDRDRLLFERLRRPDLLASVGTDHGLARSEFLRRIGRLRRGLTSEDRLRSGSECARIALGGREPLHHGWKLRVPQDPLLHQELEDIWVREWIGGLGEGLGCRMQVRHGAGSGSPQRWMLEPCAVVGREAGKMLIGKVTQRALHE